MQLNINSRHPLAGGDPNASGSLRRHSGRDPESPHGNHHIYQ
jgi:hypothetical protein